MGLEASSLKAVALAVDLGGSLLWENEYCISGHRCGETGNKVVII